LLAEKKNRNVVPRWRSFDQTVRYGELSGLRERPSAPEDNAATLARLRYAEWLDSKTVWHASDVLNSAVAIGNETSYRDVAQFILDNSAAAPPGLISLARTFLDPAHKFVEMRPSPPADMIGREIHLLRKRLEDEPRNSIVWTDLARLYTSLGNDEKAGQAIRAALYISPTNRFTLRSAGRFFLHIGDAPYILRIFRAHADVVSRDPWLIAADIGISSACEAPSGFAKKGSSAAENSGFSNFSRTELQSALATLELNHGKTRGARRLFKDSLIAPNENSLAQVEWAERWVGGIAIQPQNLKIPLSFEANAYDAFKRERWWESLECALQWLDDEQFSSRPLYFISHVDSSILEDYSLSIKLIRKALDTHVGNPELLNNLAFALANAGELKEAEDALNGANRGLASEAANVALAATRGLVLMRKGELIKGRESYREAYEKAKRLGLNRRYRQFAAIYLAREEALAQTPEAEIAYCLAKNELGDNPEPDVKLIFDRVTDLFETKRVGRAS